MKKTIKRVTTGKTRRKRITPYRRKVPYYLPDSTMSSDCKPIIFLVVSLIRRPETKTSNEALVRHFTCFFTLDNFSAILIATRFFPFSTRKRWMMMCASECCWRLTAPSGPTAAARHVWNSACVCVCVSVLKNLPPLLPCD